MTTGRTNRVDVTALVSDVCFRQKSIYWECCVGRRTVMMHISLVRLKFLTFFGDPAVVNFAFLGSLFLAEIFRNLLDIKIRKGWF
jgi:hypothetical protein